MYKYSLTFNVTAGTPAVVTPDYADFDGDKAGHYLNGAQFHQFQTSGEVTVRAKTGDHSAFDDIDSDPTVTGLSTFQLVGVTELEVSATSGTVEVTVHGY